MHSEKGAAREKRHLVSPLILMHGEEEAKRREKAVKPR
jgi:hypothetical protein